MAVRCPGLVAAKQAKITTIPPPCLKVVWGVCARGADVLWLIFANNGTVHYDQTSPLLSHLSKRHYSTGLVVNLQIYTMLPCSREEASSWSGFLLTRRMLLVPSFPDCAVMNFKLNSSRVWDIALRFLWYCVNTRVNAPDECTHKILFL